MSPRKRTRELQVGDVIVSLDGRMTERVTAVEPPVPGGVTYKLHVERQFGAEAPAATFFYSGCDALHRVVT